MRKGIFEGVGTVRDDGLASDSIKLKISISLKIICCRHPLTYKFETSAEMRIESTSECS